MNHVGIWIALALFGTFYLPTGVLAACGMLPTLVAYVVAVKSEPYRLTSIGVMNVAGVLPYLSRLWFEQHDLAMVFYILQDPYTWFVMYGASFAGLVIFYIVSTIVTYIFVFWFEEKIIRFRKKQNEIVEEWGAEVKPNSGGQPQR